MGVLTHRVGSYKVLSKSVSRIGALFSKKYRTKLVVDIELISVDGLFAGGKVEPEKVKELILDGLPGAEVEVKDKRGTGDHFEAVVKWDGFEGLPLIQQHRRIYDAVGRYLTKEIHALQLRTMTPNQAQNEE